MKQTICELGVVPAPTERMRELIVRDVATEVGICGSLAEPFEAWKIRMKILRGRDQHLISP